MIQVLYSSSDGRAGGHDVPAWVCFSHKKLLSTHGGFASPHAGVLPGRFRLGVPAASGLWFWALPGRFRRLLPGCFKLVLPALKHLAEAPACGFYLMEACF